MPMRVSWARQIISRFRLQKMKTVTNNNSGNPTAAKVAGLASQMNLKTIPTSPVRR